MHRTQFTFYESFSKALRRIRKKSDRADAYDAICDYALYGIEPDLETLPPPVAIAFDLIRPNLDTARRKAASGKKGGKAADKQNASKIETELELELESEIESKSKSESKSESEGEGFTDFEAVRRAMEEMHLIGGWE